MATLFALSATISFYVMMRGVQVWGAGSEARGYLAAIRVLAALAVLAGLSVFIAIYVDVNTMLPALQSARELFAPPPVEP